MITIVNNPNITGGNTVFKRISTLAMGCSFAAAMLAGCGGGGGASTPPVSPIVKPGGNANVAMTFHFNNATGTAAVRGRKYTSRNTAGLGISWRVHGSSTTFANTVAGLRSPNFVTKIAGGYSSNNITCQAAALDGSYSCQLLVPAPVGYDDFQITTWDQNPATLGTSNGFGGTFAANANDLSTNVVSNQLIVQNTTNTISYTLNGVVATVALSVSPNSLVSGGPTAQTATLNVLALDADGNIIIGADPYVDNAGNPVTIAVSKAEAYPVPLTGAAAPAGGNAQFTAFSTSGNSCTATTCSFVNPTVLSATVNYNNLETSSVTYSAAVSSSAATLPSTGAVLKFTNTVTNPLGVPGSPVMNLLANPAGASVAIAAGSFGDQHLYVANAAANTIEQITPGAGLGSTPVISATYTVPTAASGLSRIAVGSDGGVWFSEYAAGKVGSYNLANGQFQEVTIAGSKPVAVVSGPDLNMWFTDQGNNQIVQLLLPSGSVTAYTPVTFSTGLSANAGLADMTSDGTNLWFVEQNTGKLGKITTAGAISEFAITGAVSPLGIAYGPDGNLWVTDPGANKVFQLSTAGVLVNAYATASSPQQIMTDRSGAMYFTEYSGTTNLIGRLSMSGLLSEYSNGVASQPFGIAQGSDGQIYFTQSSGSNVGYFTP